eukprot:CAMPEP_0178990578 /NCGR_PEP_ID=MMETSP0795-20121207/5040_1 /TAXON_ID=88552 /ORGANISM="Amoebophrya sp., Strain Ameob2" /LENGTH=290 /DNA_ID=CAMNT_0020682171 /DNA_START=155 /DNA_END=1027 /DNA_ORIENTATION=+
MVVTSEQIGAAEAAFEKLPLSKKLEAVGALARAERSAAANPYGFPLSSTGIPIVQGLDDDSVLGSHDIVGVTFWIACASMLAGSVFFFSERATVPEKWKTSVTVAGLVTGIAFWNYCFMRESWVETQTSPTVYRYTDWLITVPLQIIEFYLILKAVIPNLSNGLFYRLMAESVLMLLCGWAGETGIVSVLCGFIPGMLCWFALIYEMFSGEAGQLAASSGNKACQSAFNTMRLIITVGWAIYPLGYYLTLLGPTATYHEQSVINIIYNIADLVNKLAFGLCIWGAAISDK